MPGFLDLPRELRIKITRPLLTVEGQIALLAVNATAEREPASFALIRDTQTVDSNEEEVYRVLANYTDLKTACKQLAVEAKEDFTHYNKNLTIRILHQNGVYHSPSSVNFSAAIKFANVSITAPRASGYWPQNGGGPDITVKITTTMPKSSNNHYRQLLNAEALSLDHSAADFANAVSRQPGRILDTKLMETFIYVMDEFASRV